ncbi:microfibril-associated glycoprotein 4-like [Pomacea canaliculata]|uniref:microfibril-associated glycoprotein 4-like n=1 Tax=Pomacea canaliculata TaxID=400727 RepID=UPI000D72AF66|nr:microfibril-associated glycoprotein 4-like [Pomacea canaliculata]
MELHLFVVLLWMVCFSPLILSPTSMVSSTSGNVSQFSKTSRKSAAIFAEESSDWESRPPEHKVDGTDCDKDSDCRLLNYHCFMYKCLCQAGLFLSWNNESCLAACNASDLVNEFVKYPQSVLHGYYLHVHVGLTLQDCMDLCVNTSDCVAFSFRAEGGRCLPHEATALDDPSLWCPMSSEGWSYFQRVCNEKSTSNSTVTASVENTWTVFQRRYNGSVDFYRNWTEYETGFGEVDGEFWLGLGTLHNITKTRPHILRIDLGDVDGHQFYAEYSTFRVDGPETNYTLTVSGYSGTAGDSLSPHNSMAFSTYDQEHDKEPSENCAIK